MTLPESTYTLRIIRPNPNDPNRILDTIRGLSWDELNHVAGKNVERGFRVDWAREVFHCPPDCNAGCYDADNFRLAHGEH